MHKLLSYVICFTMLVMPVVAYTQGQHPPVADTLLTVDNVDSETFSSGPTRFEPVGYLPTVPARQIPVALLDSLRNDDDFWYANQIPQKKKAENVAEQPEGRSIFNSQWFRDLLWIVILCSFIAVVIWYLIAGNILIFRKEPKKIATPTEEENFDDIFSIQYDTEIAMAEKANDYRLAVRLWYLYVLKELSGKELIDYRFGRTNRDYVQQLYQSDYYRDFFRLTRNFDYTWYGQFSLTAETYYTMRNDFSRFKERLR